jgi:beta-glucosidase
MPLPGGFQVLACAKHFVGDGGTHGGKDQGDTRCDEATLRTTHLAPYRDAIEAGVGSIMVSYSSWNGVKMHGHKQLLTEVLKGELGFGGFLVSDWAAIDQLPGDYRSDIKTSINAGLDMVMIPYGPGRSNNYVEFVTLLADLAASGEVPADRIDDAVRRILTVKQRMGLFEHPQANPGLVSVVGSAEHRAVARECVRQSLVLLKNERQTLPLSAEVRHLVLVGDAANDVGIQCGGWKISHQGRTGVQLAGGTSILTALRDAVGAGTRITQSLEGADAKGADAIIVVMGEAPYAEGRGDRQDLRLGARDQALIQQAKRTGAPVITVLLSGRPLVLDSALENSDALIAAWLPGTEGQGVTDVLLGDHASTGKLPVHWPRDHTQLAVSELGDTEPLFPLGFGLTYPKRARTTSLSGPVDSLPQRP